MANESAALSAEPPAAPPAAALPPEVNDSARRLNKLARALNARRYCEIGVFEGATLRAVEIEHRVGVDPEFRLPVEQLASPRVELQSLTSDAYFATLEPHVTFDVYYIDGLHTFEQTLRDFCNALLHSHRRTVWLIDDTMPDDVYSTLPTMERAYRFRDAASNTGNRAWHGDVFKLAFFIHDFCPSLDYRTLFGSGNPQTLVWRGLDGGRVPRFNNLEAISRLNYFDLHDHSDVLRSCSEDDAIALCLKALERTDKHSRRDRWRWLLRRNK
jgi:hypothetical protein